VKPVAPLRRRSRPTALLTSLRWRRRRRRGRRITAAWLATAGRPATAGRSGPTRRRPRPRRAADRRHGTHRWSHPRRRRSDHGRRPVHGGRASVRVAGPVVVVVRAARVPGPPDIVGRPVIVEYEWRCRDTEAQASGRHRHRAAWRWDLKKRRIDPAATRPRLYIAPVEVLLAAEHGNELAAKQHRDARVESARTRTQVNTGGHGRGRRSRRGRGPPRRYE